MRRQGYQRAAKWARSRPTLARPGHRARFREEAERCRSASISPKQLGCRPRCAPHSFRPSAQPGCREVRPPPRAALWLTRQFTHVALAVQIGNGLVLAALRLSGPPLSWRPRLMAWRSLARWACCSEPWAPQWWRGACPRGVPTAGGGWRRRRWRRSSRWRACWCRCHRRARRRPTSTSTTEPERRGPGNTPLERQRTRSSRRRGSPLGRPERETHQSTGGRGARTPRMPCFRGIGG
jgi:hypothetical protein